MEPETTDEAVTDETETDIEVEVNDKEEVETTIEQQLEVQVEVEQESEQEKDKETIAKLQRENEMLRDHEDTSRQLAETAKDQWSGYEDAKSIASSWKKSYDETVKRLNEHASSHPSYGPLFDKENEDMSAKVPEEIQPEPQSEEPNEWRDVSVETLNLPAALCQSLCEAELDTLGKIADYTSCDKRLIDIDGIGKAGAEKFDAASMKYFEENPIHANEVVAEDAVKDDDEPVDEDEDIPVIDLDGNDVKSDE